MTILVVGLIAAVLVMLLPRFFGRGQERMLEQYAVLEKRFGFDRQVAKSRWGRGIGERFSLKGESRGYPLSLYAHHQKLEGRKVEWTSLVFEALFAEDIELCIWFVGTEVGARFQQKENLPRVRLREGVEFRSNDDLEQYLLAEGLQNRLGSFAKMDRCGAVLLSKGFLEYRETGTLDNEERRLRFQEAILLLANLCDALSIYVGERKKEVVLERSTVC